MHIICMVYYNINYNDIYNIHIINILIPGYISLASSHRFDPDRLFEGGKGTTRCLTWRKRTRRKRGEQRGFHQEKWGFHGQNAGKCW